MVCPFSVDHCIVYTSISDFWLSLWYHNIFLHSNVFECILNDLSLERKKQGSMNTNALLKIYYLCFTVDIYNRKSNYLGKTANLSRVASNETVYKWNSRTWHRQDTNNTTLLVHYKLTNDSRYKEVHGEEEYDYKLKIKNFGEKTSKCIIPVLMDGMMTNCI